jgi:hypothetical protein
MRQIPYTALLALTATLACGEVPNAPLENQLSEATDEAASGSGFFSIRRDFRKCAFPMCGGWFVARVNQPTTRCSGGTWAEECYVSELDTEALGDVANADFQIVRARMRSKNYGAPGRYGVLDVSAAYSAATTGTPTGSYWGLADLGFECFAAPCYSVEANRLNYQRRPTLSGVDATGVELLPGFEQRIYDAFFIGELIGAGDLAWIPNEGPAGDGRHLIATQLWVPAIAPVPAELSCTADADCGASIYNRFVNSPADCYCTACAQPVNAAQAAANEASYLLHCGAEYSRDPSCPQVRCSQPRPTVCTETLSCDFAPN